MFALTWAILSTLVLSASAGTKLWDGSFNNYASAADFDKCKWRKFYFFRRPFTDLFVGSWANQVGAYQWVSEL